MYVLQYSLPSYFVQPITNNAPSNCRRNKFESRLTKQTNSGNVILRNEILKRWKCPSADQALNTLARASIRTFRESLYERTTLIVTKHFSILLTLWRDTSIMITLAKVELNLEIRIEITRQCFNIRYTLRIVIRSVH